MQFLKWVFFNFFKDFTFFLVLGFPGMKAEPDEQNEMASGGEGGGGSKPTKKSAETYLKEVREMFEDKKYDMFLQVMKDFSTQRADIVCVMGRVKELLKGNNNLIQGFNLFLPKGYEISVDEEKASPEEKISEFGEAFDFITLIKERDEHVYTSFLDVVNKHWGEQDVASLFWDHPDLLEEFKIF
ncbi:paired amphipathic helix protein Sin3-like 2 [Gossypium australe]|uniref:Paired amphipathic helix protein Sin3-like 2 n=1 Tax=Gossypium australe TaxID=47621 RepID=A0A5B6UIE2_9ROSI|nr:paired amphipathic helix protein Sin3-like 2 [Gossypium australe]